MPPEEGEEVAVEDVAVVLERRWLEVAAGEVVVEEAFAEGGEGDPLRFAVAVVDGAEALAELALSPLAVPGRFATECFLHLLAGGVAVLDSPDDIPLALVADDGSPARHELPG